MSPNAADRSGRVVRAAFMMLLASLRWDSSDVDSGLQSLL